MLTMILRQSLMLVLIGIASGVIVSLGATRVIASLLFGVGVNDIPTYAAVITLLGSAAFLASYIPARRAMRVIPWWHSAMNDPTGISTAGPRRRGTH